MIVYRLTRLNSDLEWLTTNNLYRWVGHEPLVCRFKQRTVNTCEPVWNDNIRKRFLKYQTSMTVIRFEEQPPQIAAASRMGRFLIEIVITWTSDSLVDWMCFFHPVLVQNQHSYKQVAQKAQVQVRRLQALQPRLMPPRHHMSYPPSCHFAWRG